MIPGALGYWCGMTTQRLAQATRPAPERAIAGIKQDVDAVKGHR